MVVMRIAEICKEKGMTSKQLAELSGIPLNTLNQYRQGLREPSLSRGLKLADALGVDPHELFEEPPED